MDYFYKVTFQQHIEAALELSERASPPQIPYQNKYTAISILQKLYQMISNQPLVFMIQYYLGNLYLDTQQTGKAYTSFTNSLNYFQHITQPEKYLNWLMDLYNMTGFALVRKQQNIKAVSVLSKALQAYDACLDLGKKMTHFHSKCEEKRPFQYLANGGVDIDRAEDSHTLTLFYLAQTYTKMGLKDRAAQFCGKTIKRQYATRKFQLQDFVMNLIGLSDYYTTVKMFSQSEYLLMCAMKFLPESEKRLYATVQMALGRILKQFHQFCCIQLKNQQHQSPDEEFLNKIVLELEEINIMPPKFMLAKNLEDCKSNFRKANTQLKKSMEYYVLDGYVTQFIQLTFDINNLYKSLALVEDDIDRQIAMLIKRRELFLPLCKELNPKAYAATYQKCLIECAQVSNSIFELKQAHYIGQDDINPKKINANKIKAMNQIGLSAIQMFRSIIQNFKNSEENKDQNYYDWIIKSTFNIAKIYSKIYYADTKERVDMLKHSLNTYKQVETVIKQGQQKLGNQKFSKEMMLTDEMLHLLPGKIDKINYR